MATIPVPETSVSYESQKLREVLLPRDAPVRDDAVVDPPYVPAAETPRTRRLRDELDKVSTSAVLFYLAGLVPIVLVALMFF